MKLLFTILALLFMTKECGQKRSEKTPTETAIVSNEDVSKMQEKEYTIKYSAISRGIFKEITVNRSTISFVKDRSSKPTIKSCNEDIWNKIMAEMDSIDLESIPKLEAPTKKRFHDGAAHASLKITIGEKVYETQSFDHDVPPKEIELLCNILVELIEE